MSIISNNTSTPLKIYIIFEIRKGKDMIWSGTPHEFKINKTKTQRFEIFSIVTSVISLGIPQLIAEYEI